jgi:hypothetical protein
MLILMLMLMMVLILIMMMTMANDTLTTLRKGRKRRKAVCRMNVMIVTFRRLPSAPVRQFPNCIYRFENWPPRRAKEH